MNAPMTRHQLTESRYEALVALTKFNAAMWTAQEAGLDCGEEAMCQLDELEDRYVALALRIKTLDDEGYDVEEGGTLVASK
jgi:hypothetical protein